MSVQEEIDKWMISVERGTVTEYELFTHLVLNAEKYPLRDVAAAIPVKLKETFKNWIAANVSNTELVFITNNSTVRPFVIIKAYSDFFHGRISGDSVVGGAEWIIRGIR